MKVVIPKSGEVLVKDLIIATSLFTRMKGLLGRKHLAHGEGLWLAPCKGIHTFGMRFAIDVIVLDRHFGIIEIINSLKPNRATKLFNNAHTILELPADSVARFGLKPGDMIEMIL